MGGQTQLFEALSLILAEVEQAQNRGDADVEMRLARIAQLMLGAISMGHTSAAVEKLPGVFRVNRECHQKTTQFPPSI
jgi:hypothetical protein